MTPSQPKSAGESENTKPDMPREIYAYKKGDQIFFWIDKNTPQKSDDGTLYIRADLSPQPAPEVVELDAKLKEIVSDSELDAVWGNANFGGTDKREVILDTLWKVACGYGTGHTSLCICTELGLIKGYRSVKGEVALTKKGQFYFREAFRDGYTPLHLQRQRGE